MSRFSSTAVVLTLRNAASEASAAAKRAFTDNVVRPVAAIADLDQPELRAALAASQVIGLGLARHVLELDVLADADPDTLRDAVGPTLDRYLTGSLRPETS